MVSQSVNQRGLVSFPLCGVCDCASPVEGQQPHCVLIVSIQFLLNTIVSISQFNLLWKLEEDGKKSFCVFQCWLLLIVTSTDTNHVQNYKWSSWFKVPSNKCVRNRLFIWLTKRTKQLAPLSPYILWISDLPLKPNGLTFSIAALY